MPSYNQKDALMDRETAKETYDYSEKELDSLFDGNEQIVDDRVDQMNREDALEELAGFIDDAKQFGGNQYTSLNMKKLIMTTLDKKGVLSYDIPKPGEKTKDFLLRIVPALLTLDSFSYDREKTSNGYLKTVLELADDITITFEPLTAVIESEGIIFDKVLPFKGSEVITPLKFLTNGKEYWLEKSDKKFPAPLTLDQIATSLTDFVFKMLGGSVGINKNINDVSVIKYQKETK